MDRERLLEELNALLDGELSAQEAKTAEARVQEDPEAARLYRQLQATRAAVKAHLGGDSEAVPDLRESIARRIREEKEGGAAVWQGEKRNKKRGRSAPNRRWIGLAAGVVVAVFGGYMAVRTANFGGSGQRATMSLADRSAATSLKESAALEESEGGLEKDKVGLAMATEPESDMARSKPKNEAAIAAAESQIAMKAAPVESPTAPGEEAFDEQNERFESEKQPPAAPPMPTMAAVMAQNDAVDGAESWKAAVMDKEAPALAAAEAAGASEPMADFDLAAQKAEADRQVIARAAGVGLAAALASGGTGESEMELAPGEAEAKAVAPVWMAEQESDESEFAASESGAVILDENVAKEAEWATEDATIEYLPAEEEMTAASKKPTDAAKRKTATKPSKLQTAEQDNSENEKMLFAASKAKKESEKYIGASRGIKNGGSDEYGSKQPSQKLDYVIYSPEAPASQMAVYSALANAASLNLQLTQASNTIQFNTLWGDLESKVIPFIKSELPVLQFEKITIDNNGEPAALSGTAAILSSVQATQPVSIQIEFRPLPIIENTEENP